jgi:3-hydroxyacyl-CoA dehydrogenase / enoyl-CoA hydratase / 3-hydroxybutyryl-CoA epimerase
MNYFKLDRQSEAVATLTFDTPKSSANVFSVAALEALESQLDALAAETELDVLFIESAKEDIFIAGADLHEIKTAEDAATVEAFVKKGQDVFNKLEKMPFVTVAVIDGACLGGGLEMALACDYRIATTHEHTRIGLPEINLGLIPGFGGTQRLYRLIGYAGAMEVILGAKQLSGETALALGIVDAAVPHGYLTFKKEALLEEILAGKLHRRVAAVRKGIRWYERYAPLRSVIAATAAKKVQEKTHGNYPAPPALIEVLKASFGTPLDEGLAIERAAVTRLALTPESKNLIRLFLISEDLKHETFGTEPPRSIRHAAVVGAGVMGSGIAWALDNRRIGVRFKVRSPQSAAKAIKHMRGIYETLKKRHKIDRRHIRLNMDRVTYAVDDKGFGRSDILIEAVSEKIDVKKAVYGEFEALLAPEAVIATNTSSIAITTLAEGMAHPERFIGMHFFNPVERMPLVEVIPGEMTDDATVATVMQLAKTMGKTPIRVKDRPGFLVNRILMPYLKEAALMFEAGETVEKIDRALKDFGMPMGAFLLIDEVGLDIGTEVAEVLHDAYGERMAMSPVLEKMVQKGWLGKKSGKGFYTHDQKSPPVNPDIRTLQTGTETYDASTITQRALYIMINEASMCLEEGIVEDAAHLDMAMVMGIGFPPFRGGLMRYADDVGISRIVDTLEQFSDLYGSRFAPSALLLSMAQKHETFYGGDQ